jgi:hypothetical protein
MRTTPIFKSPHVWDLMDDRNDIYKLSEHTLKDTINLNYNSMFQDNEKYNHIYNVWCHIDKSHLFNSSFVNINIANVHAISSTILLHNYVTPTPIQLLNFRYPTDCKESHKTLYPSNCSHYCNAMYPLDRPQSHKVG